MAGVLKSIFTFDGHPGHEIVMLHEADFVDKTMYRRNPIWGQEDDGSPIKAVWKPMDHTSILAGAGWSPKAYWRCLRRTRKLSDVRSSGLPQYPKRARNGRSEIVS